MADRKPWEDPNKICNAYDLSSGLAAMVGEERMLRRQFQQAIPLEAKPWEDPNKVCNPYNLNELHKRISVRRIIPIPPSH